MRTLFALTLACLSVTASCVHSIESNVKVLPSPDEDHEYQPAWAKATQARTVFKDFETRYSVTATYLSPDFRNAFAKRYERVYKQAPGEFSEAATKSGFFVSITAPDEDRTDLENPHHWTILLDQANDKGLKPTLVKRIDDKERWRAFFPTIDEWTQEYLVVFDAPNVNPNSPELVAKTAIGLTFANRDAHVDLTW